MCDQTELEYSAGEIVWYKLSNVWWPAQVQDEVEEEVTQGLRKTPLVVVKFFDEDSYEFARNINQVCSYNSARKFDFIKKGMDLYRTMGDTNKMNKFPIDVVKAEELTGGNINILDDPRLAPEKKINIKEIFSTPKPEKNNKKTKNSAVKPKPSPHNNALVRLNLLAAKKGYFAKDLLQVSKYENNRNHQLKCHSCNFICSRLGSLFDHGKYNVQCSKVVSLKLTKSHSSNVKFEKSPVKRKSVVNSDSPIIKKKPKVAVKSPAEPKKIIKVKTMSVKEIKEKDKKKAEEIKEKLLLDWDDEDGMGEDTDTPVDSSPEKSADKTEQNDNKASCFDFEENEEDVERNIRFGQKLPRVIPKDDKSKENKTKDDDLLEMEFNDIMKETSVPVVPIVTDSFLLDSSVLPGCSGKAEKNLGLEAKVEIVTGNGEDVVDKDSCLKCDDDNASLLRALECDSPQPVHPQIEQSSKKRVKTPKYEVIKKIKSDKELLESLRSDSDDNSSSVDNNNLILPKKSEVLSDQSKNEKPQTPVKSETLPQSSKQVVCEIQADVKQTVKEKYDKKAEENKPQRSRSSRRLSSAFKVEDKKKRDNTVERNKTKTDKIEISKSIEGHRTRKSLNKESSAKEPSATETRMSRRLSIKTEPNETWPAKVKDKQLSGSKSGVKSNSQQRSVNKHHEEVKINQRLSSSREKVNSINSDKRLSKGSKSPVKVPELSTEMVIPDDEKLLDKLLAQVFADSSSEKRRKSRDKRKSDPAEKPHKKSSDDLHSLSDKPVREGRTPKKSKVMPEKEDSSKKMLADRDPTKDRTTSLSPVKTNNLGKDIAENIISKTKSKERKSREEIRRSIEDEKKLRSSDKSSKGSKSPLKSPVQSVKSKFEGNKESTHNKITKDFDKLSCKTEIKRPSTNSPKSLATSLERQSVDPKVIKKEVPNPLALLYARRDEKSPKSGKSKRAPIVDKSIVDLFTPDVVKTVIPSKSSSGSSSDSGSSSKRRDSLKSSTIEKSKKEEKSKDSNQSSPLKSPKYEAIISSPKSSVELKAKSNQPNSSPISSPLKEETRLIDGSNLTNELSSPDKEIKESPELVSSNVTTVADSVIPETMSVEALEPKVIEGVVETSSELCKSSDPVVAIEAEAAGNSLLEQQVNSSDKEAIGRLDFDSNVDPENLTLSYNNETDSVHQNLVDSKSEQLQVSDATDCNEHHLSLKESKSSFHTPPNNFLEFTKIPPQRDKVEEVVVANSVGSNLKFVESENECFSSVSCQLEGSPSPHFDNKLSQSPGKMALGNVEDECCVEDSRKIISEFGTSFLDDSSSNVEISSPSVNKPNTVTFQDAIKKSDDNIDQEMEEMFYDGEPFLQEDVVKSDFVPCKKEASSTETKENNLPLISDQAVKQLLNSGGVSLDNIPEIRGEETTLKDITSEIRSEEDNVLNDLTGDEVLNESQLPQQECLEPLPSQPVKIENELKEPTHFPEETPRVDSPSLPVDIPPQNIKVLPESLDELNVDEKSKDTDEIPETKTDLDEEFEVTKIEPTVDLSLTGIFEKLPDGDKLLASKSPSNKCMESPVSELSSTGLVPCESDIFFHSVCEASLPTPEVEPCSKESASNDFRESANTSMVLNSPSKEMNEAQITERSTVVPNESTEITFYDSHFLSPKNHKSNISSFSNDFFQSDVIEKATIPESAPPSKSHKKDEDGIMSSDKSNVLSDNELVSNEVISNTIGGGKDEISAEISNTIAVNMESTNEISTSPKIIENQVRELLNETISKTPKEIVLPTITDVCSLTSDSIKVEDGELEADFSYYDSKEDVVSEVVISDDKVEEESNLYNFDDQVGSVVSNSDYPVKKAKAQGGVKINFSPKSNSLLMNVSQDFPQKVMSADFLTPEKIKAIFSKKEDTGVSIVVPPQTQLFDLNAKVLGSAPSQPGNSLSSDFRNMEWDINAMPIVIADANELVSSMDTMPVCNSVVVTSASLPKLVSTSSAMPALVSSTPNLTSAVVAGAPASIATSSSTQNVPSVSSLATGAIPQPASEMRCITIGPYKGEKKKFDCYIKLVPTNKGKVVPKCKSEVIRIPGRNKQMPNRIIKFIQPKKHMASSETKELYIMTSTGKKKFVFKGDRPLFNKAVPVKKPDPTKSIVVTVNNPVASTSRGSNAEPVNKVTSRTIQLVNKNLNKGQIGLQPVASQVIMASDRVAARRGRPKKIQTPMESSSRVRYNTEGRQIKVPNILGSKSSLLKPAHLRNEKKVTLEALEQGFVKIKTSQVSEASQLIASTKARFDNIKQVRNKMIPIKQDILAKALGDTFQGGDDIEPLNPHPPGPSPVVQSPHNPVSYNIQQLPIGFQNTTTFLQSMPVITESVVQTQPLFQIDSSQTLTPENSQELLTQSTADHNLAGIELLSDPSSYQVSEDVSSIPLPPARTLTLVSPACTPPYLDQSQADQNFTLFHNVGNS